MTCYSGNASRMYYFEIRKSNSAMLIKHTIEFTH